ncbi:MAG: PH domain-containing protein [Bacteroidales bacterium]|nr:PH domain-containing protein [Bacteroidales bacterium]MBE6241667.1 PH domain-containing protein [Bacteroidales bacterium]
MGFFSELMGNASELDSAALNQEFKDIICEGEEIECGFKVLRDKWVFTNKRLIMVDVQGLTGKKKEYHSIPYRSITHFAVETAGTFDADCELDIWISGSPEPYQYELSHKVNVVAIQKTLAYHMLIK